MREMHKWKDKASFSLDSRQIFFLFFGLSVVGCFVFALGVMVGRNTDWQPDGPIAGVGSESLAALETLDADPDPPDAFTFRDGLKEPATTGLPKTRIAGSGDDDTDEQADNTEESDAAAPDKSTEPSSKDQAETKAEVLASTTKNASSDKSRVFTLQMKAFARRQEADAFAERLRRNGHDVRIEEHEVRGRRWHRVRMGKFPSWDEALAAKAEFERAEHIIAYVVRH
jgi:septal ring-binding cell division protein DamX